MIARSSLTPVTLVVTLSATVAIATPSTGDADSTSGDPSKTLPGSPTGDHGAFEEATQLSALSTLQRPDELAAAPKNVDPDLWASLIPEDNKPTAARIELGRKLYFDPRLSKDGTVSCATCHDVGRGFTDQRATSQGIQAQVGERNAPTTLNAVFFQKQFWDGRAGSLEEQAKLPIINPIEMGHPDGASATAAIAAIPEYEPLFQKAYGRSVNYDDIGRAIASFERTLVFIDAPFDDFLQGDTDAISPSAIAGWTLFNGKARCVSCHHLNSFNVLGTDDKFHNIGVSATVADFEPLAKRALDELKKDASDATLERLALETELSELGRFVVTQNRSDIGSFKTQQLRNIALTAPYMHNGSIKTLWDVMDHYNKGGEDNPYLDGGIEALNLSEREIDQLVAFMFTLTDKRFSDANQAELDRQRAIAQTHRPNRDNALVSREVVGFERRTLGTP